MDYDPVSAQGTPGFSAPEQAEHSSKLGIETDIYSLGCILYYIYTQQPLLPEKGETSGAQTHTLSKIPSSIRAIIAKATAKQADQRYSSVHAFQQDIAKYFNGHAPDAEHAHFGKLTWLFILRNRMTVMSTVTVCGLLAFGALYYSYSLAQQKANALEAKQQSSYLAGQVSNLNQQLDSSREVSTRSAKLIAETAQQLRIQSIFDNPSTAVYLSQTLINISRQYDPAESTALNADAFLSFIKLDIRKYREISALGAESSITDRFSPLAERFSDFQFGRSYRPSVNQLVTFFETASELRQGLTDESEQIISYDSACRTDHSNYHKVLESFIRYRHYGSKEISIQYQVSDEQLHLRSNIPLRLSGHVSHQRCVLRYMPFKALKLTTPHAFNLAELKELRIETLDISESPKAYLEGPLDLPQLQAIRISKAVTLPDHLAMQLQKIPDLTIRSD